MSVIHSPESDDSSFLDIVFRSGLGILRGGPSYCGVLAVTTESGADIQPEQLEESGVRLLPVVLGHGEKIYAEHELAPQDLVNLIRVTGEAATPWPVPDQTIAQVFEEALTDAEQVVHIASGSGLTPHFHIVNRVAQQFGGRVTVLDSGTLSYGLGVQARHAAALARQGADAETITEALYNLRPRLMLQFAAASLDFLRMNDRLNNVSALFGKLVGLRPILAVEGGELLGKGQALGQDAAVRQLVKAAQQFQAQQDEPLTLFSGYTVGGEEAARALQSQLEATFPGSSVAPQPLGSGLTATLGPGAASVLAFPARFQLG